MNLPIDSHPLFIPLAVFMAIISVGLLALLASSQKPAPSRSLVDAQREPSKTGSREERSE
jgi:hypothetical protein